jgi:ABC-type antimicrobial peptide transport system permease subunit
LDLVQTVRSDLATLDPTMALGRVESFERVIAGSYARQRFSMLLLSGFAIVALVLAAIGIYGVISFSVQQRTTEMAIRMAMGAQAPNIIRLVLRHGTVLAAIGVAVGLFGAWAAGRITASQLYGTSPNNPAMFVGVAVALVGVALIATFIPALRATRIHPAEVLKPE